ncbi:arylsulfatase [Bacteroides pyogenes JCM 6292]|uniref:Arylsulfatase n=1 Tax=Bacteroides pyogenes JCM 6292 TaxID=1235809 RepID=W4PA11_9BACE|nr:arylsulfatase [Bacteroides pyogenes JCM 6292]
MCTSFYGLYSVQAEATDRKNERPNILWLTFEDTSAYEFGCYGNKGYILPMQTVLLLAAYSL